MQHQSEACLRRMPQAVKAVGCHPPAHHTKRHHATHLVSSRFPRSRARLCGWLDTPVTRELNHYPPAAAEPHSQASSGSGTPSLQSTAPQPCSFPKAYSSCAKVADMLGRPLA